MFMSGYMWGLSVHMADRVYLDLHFEIAVYILISNTLYSTGNKIFMNLGFLCERVIISTTYIYLLVNTGSSIISKFNVKSIELANLWANATIVVITLSR